ncbi:MAG: hypothetical protein Q8M92_06855, partial [Candidatus Subteraquimicrobiales bacterium]|nr:hypothetical protein [Candidatus Subteraquimicrobiales bacterium]
SPAYLFKRYFAVPTVTCTKCNINFIKNHMGGLRGAYHTNPFHGNDYTRKQLLMKALSQHYQYVIIK